MAQYKDKKRVKSQDGGMTTVYVYGPRQIQRRHEEKAERLESLRKSISDLRKQVREDLKKEDIRQVALAVALIDHTYERVGNEESAEDGHVGVTGWTSDHVSFKGNKAYLDYTGKSGVKQHKVVDDPVLVKALKEACDGDGDCLVGVDASRVNEYLREFDITAKDLRGFHANQEMHERLKQIRSKGGKLPDDKKEREKLLKKEFKQALEETAKAVGHESSTLRSQYLVPGLEDDFMDDGTVTKSMVKSGTRSQSEKEDDALEKRRRITPLKKPPRYDLHKPPNSEDPDLQGLGAGDNGDRDLSLNYKKVGIDRLTRYSTSRLGAKRLRSHTDMPTRLSPSGVAKFTRDLDRIASTVQTNAKALGLPLKLAHDFAWRVDFISDHVERRVGLRKKAQMDPPGNFTETDLESWEFDPAEIGEETDGALLRDQDEPYMDVFKQDEFDQLRQVQQDGMFSNAKAAASMIRKLANLARAHGIQLKVAEDEGDEDEGDEDEDEGETAGKKKAARDPYGLFG